MIIFYFILGLFCFSCGETSDEIPELPDPPIEESRTYLALGDSYTIGESVAFNERFPNQLGDSLKAQNLGFDTIQIVAQTGWTTDELNVGINSRDDLLEQYDLVSLLIGVNNQFRGRPVETYITEFEGLLNRAITFAGGKKENVIVLSIPDYAFTSFGGGNPAISAGIDEYNAVNKQIADSLGIQYFDITPISREGLNNTDLVASDGLHPSAKQYAQWVELMLPTVINILKD